MILLGCLPAGDAEGVSRLLDEDPQALNTCDESGVSAISLAIYQNRPDIAQIFIDRGASFNVFEACATGTRVQALLSNDEGAVNTFAPGGFAPLAWPKNAARVCLLRAGAKVSVQATNALKVVPLHSAAQRGNQEMMQLLIQHGADRNAASDDGRTPADLAAL